METNRDIDSQIEELQKRLDEMKAERKPNPLLEPFCHTTLQKQKISQLPKYSIEDIRGFLRYPEECSDSAERIFIFHFWEIFMDECDENELMGIYEIEKQDKLSFTDNLRYNYFDELILKQAIKDTDNSVRYGGWYVGDKIVKVAPNVTNLDVNKALISLGNFDTELKEDGCVTYTFSLNNFVNTERLRDNRNTAYSGNVGEKLRKEKERQRSFFKAGRNVDEFDKFSAIEKAIYLLIDTYADISDDGSVSPITNKDNVTFNYIFQNQVTEIILANNLPISVDEFYKVVRDKNLDRAIEIGDRMFDWNVIENMGAKEC